MNQINQIEIMRYLVVFFLGFFTAMFFLIDETTFVGFNVINVQERSVKIPLFAVGNDDHGYYGFAILRIVKGNDKVLLETNPFNEIDLQYSVRKAVDVAKRILQIKKTGMDFLFSFEFNTTVVGGESAGAALTILTISALTGKKINPYVGITGTIDSDGHIGHVAGIIEKLQAAKELGIKIFLIPKGQRYWIYYKPVIKKEHIFGFEIYDTYYVPQKIDLVKYAKEQLGIKVVEVRNIYEAMKYFFS